MAGNKTAGERFVEDNGAFINGMISGVIDGGNAVVDGLTMPGDALAGGLDDLGGEVMAVAGNVGAEIVNGIGGVAEGLSKVGDFVSDSAGVVQAYAADDLENFQKSNGAENVRNFWDGVERNMRDTAEEMHENGAFGIVKDSQAHVERVSKGIQETVETVGASVDAAGKAVSGVVAEVGKVVNGAAEGVGKAVDDTVAGTRQGVGDALENAGRGIKGESKANEAVFDDMAKGMEDVSAPATERASSRRMPEEKQALDLSNERALAC